MKNTNNLENIYESMYRGDYEIDNFTLQPGSYKNVIRQILDYLKKISGDDDQILSGIDNADRHLSTKDLLCKAISSSELDEHTKQSLLRKVNKYNSICSLLCSFDTLHTVY